MKYLKDPKFIVPCMALLHLWMVWPGVWTADTHSQYAIALSGVYSDHHPPMMSWVWGHLNGLLSGSGLLLTLNLSLLYGAVFYLMQSFAQRKIRFVFLLLPLIPQIAIYAGFIWKDVGFAFSFLACSAYLAYLSSTRKSFSFYSFISVFLILFYGTGLKFQAQYGAPVLLIWIAYILAHYAINLKRFVPILGVLLCVFYGGLKTVNDYWVPEAQRNHSWQYVKIYDLAAISLDTGIVLLPDFTKNKLFSKEALRETFFRHGIPVSVDELVFGQDAILRKGENAEERALLYKAWLQAVTSHPLFYLKHRMHNVAYALLSRPGFMHAPKIVSYISTEGSMLYRTLYSTLSVLFYLFMAHINVVILSIIYLVYSVCHLRRPKASWAALPLFYFNFLAFTMLLTLFFCSMAGTPRYTYIIVCMVHASHVFAYQCYKGSKFKCT